MLLFSSVEGQVPKNLSHPLPKAAHLDKAGLDGVPETDSDEQEDQDIVGQIGINAYYDRI